VGKREGSGRLSGETRGRRWRKRKGLKRKEAVEGPLTRRRRGQKGKGIGRKETETPTRNGEYDSSNPSSCWNSRENPVAKPEK